jgi:lipoprotein-anchoring transpeptidase ErfK/SrfK
MTLHIDIDVSQQTLLLVDAGEVCGSWPVATSVRGRGERLGSQCTPRGRHVVRAGIGAGLPRAAVHVGRRWTGEICDEAAWSAEPGRDWILSRILWLSGCEPGFNRLGQVDTMRRYIYIHGCPDLEPVGAPVSHGCVRMTNDDVIELFGRVPAGTTVNIHA